MLHKTWSVIRREFVERVRTRAFIISTVLGPLFFAAMAIIPGYLMSRDTGLKRIAVVDATSNEFGQKLSVALKAAKRLRKKELELGELGSHGRLLEIAEATFGVRPLELGHWDRARVERPWLVVPSEPLIALPGE